MFHRGPHGGRAGESWRDIFRSESRGGNPGVSKVMAPAVRMLDGQFPFEPFLIARLGRPPRAAGLPLGGALEVSTALAQPGGTSDEPAGVSMRSRKRQPLRRRSDSGVSYRVFCSSTRPRPTALEALKAPRRAPGRSSTSNLISISRLVRAEVTAKYSAGPVVMAGPRLIKAWPKCRKRLVTFAMYTKRNEESCQGAAAPA